MKKMTVVGVTVAAGLLFTLVSMPSQTFSNITVQKDLKVKVHHDSRYPLELQSISTSGSQATKEYSYHGGERFLKDLKLTLINRSEKNIVSLQIQVAFSDIVNGKHFSPTIRFIRLGPQDLSEATSSYPVLISGFGTHELRLTKIDADALTTWLRDKGAFARGNVMITLYEVTYDDDTRWAAGRYLRRDELERTKWNLIEKESGRQLASPFFLFIFLFSFQYLETLDDECTTVIPLQLTCPPQLPNLSCYANDLSYDDLIRVVA